MEGRDKTEEKISSCIELILKKGIEDNGRNLRNLLLQLQTKHIILIEKRKSLTQDSKDHGCENVIQEISSIIAVTNNGRQSLVECLEDKVLKFNGKLCQVANATLGEEKCNDELLSLVLMWEELIKYQDQMKSIINDIWTGKECLTDGDWPLEFIYSCSKSIANDRSKLQKFMSDASHMLSKSFNKESIGEEIRRCLTIVLRKCGGSSDDNLRRLSLLLHGENIITEDKAQEAKQLLDDGNTVEVLEKLVHWFTESGKGMQYFKEILRDEDFQVDADAMDIVYSLLGDNKPEAERLKLILYWDELIDSQDQVKTVIGRIWKGKSEAYQNNWPLDFIRFGLNQHETDLHEVKELVAQLPLSSQETNDSIEEKIERCLFIILKTCDHSSGEILREISLSLQAEEIISEDQKQQADKLVEDNNKDRALQKLTRWVVESDKGIKQFNVILQDFELDAKVKDIVHVILGDKKPEAERLILILLCHELNEAGENIKPVIKQIFSGNLEAFGKNWTLDFIHFCLTQHDVDLSKVRELTSQLHTLTEKPEVRFVSSSLQGTVDGGGQQASDAQLQKNPGSEENRHDDNSRQNQTQPHHDSVIALDDGWEEESSLTNSTARRLTQRQFTTNKPKPTEIELRVKLNEVGKNHVKNGFSLRIYFEGGDKEMSLHELGYYYTTIPCYDRVEFQYRYYLKKKGHRADEYLSKHQRRLISLKNNWRDVFLDVVVFSQQHSQPHWDKEINVAMKSFLVQKSSMQSNASVFRVSDVYYWLCAAQDGWTYISQNSRNSHNLQKKIIESYLEVFLQDFEQPTTKQDLVNRVLCCLAIIMAMRELNHEVESPKLFKKICESLQIQGLDREYQDQLYQSIKNVENWNIGDLLASISHILKLVKVFPKPLVILVLPVYGLLSCKGNPYNERLFVPTAKPLYIKAVLPTLDEDIWKSFQRKLVETSKPKKIKKLFGMSTIISVLAETHPYIVDTYQFFISLDVLIDLVKEKCDVAEKFQIDSIFAQILPLLEPKSVDSTGNKRKKNVEKVTSLKKYLERQFAKLEESHHVHDKEKLFQTDRLLWVLKCIVNTLESVLKLGSCGYLEQLCTPFLLSMGGHCLTWLKKPCINNGEFDLSNMMKEILQLAGRCIMLCSKEKLDEKLIEFYSSLFCQRWEDKEFQDRWTKEIARNTLKYLSKPINNGQCSQRGNEQLHFDLIPSMPWSSSNDEDSYLKLYEKIAGKKHHPVLDDILLLFASQRAEQLFTKHSDHFKASSLSGILKPFANAVTNMFRKYDRDEVKFGSTALKFITGTTFFLTLYNCLEHKDILELFSSSSFLKLDEIRLKAETLLQDVSNKTIMIEETRIVLGNEDRVKDLLAVIEQKKGSADGEEAEYVKIEVLSPELEDLKALQMACTSQKNQEISDSMMQMNDILRMFDCNTRALQFFVEACRSIDNDHVCVNYDSLKQTLTRAQSNLSLKQAEEFFHDITDIEEMILMTHLKESSIFLFKLHELVERERIEALDSSIESDAWSIDWTTILHDIWQKAKYELQKLIEDVKKGSLSLTEITHIFSESKGNIEKLKIELQFLYCFYAHLHKEISQGDQMQKEVEDMAIKICDIFDFQRCLKILDLFKGFASHLRLDQDFEAIQNFECYCQSFKKQEFENLRKIKAITPEELHVLQSFSSQKDLIEWLRSSMDKGRDDVKGLCLVAEKSMYAEEWSLLGDAVDGFHDLIFLLEEISNVDDLLVRCKRVWEKISADKSILKKWDDAGENLSWYKLHEKLFASTERAALHFTHIANRHGIYIVGCIEKDEAPCLANSIRLKVPAKEADGVMEENEADSALKPKEISLFELHDNESKLMLISNEEDASEMQFVKTLNAMEGLARAYLDLIDSGFMLFNEWSATLRCSESKSEKCAVISEKLFSLQVTFKHDLEGFTQLASIDDVNELSSIMRETMSRWNSHISTKRLEHYFLNEYSIQQIRLLCEQLGKVHISPLSEQICMMLSNVPRSILTEHIRESLNEALTISVEDLNGSEIYDQGDQVSDDDVCIQRKQHAVRCLVKQESMSEKLAKAAVQAEGFSDLVRCSNWVMLHENDFEEIEDKSRSFDQSIGIVHEDLSTEEDNSVLLAKSARTLEGLIKLLQKEAYISNINAATQTIIDGYLKTTQAIAMKNCLSVHHLGKFLTILRKQLRAKEANPVRILGPPFIHGRPNLIVLEPSGMIHVAISLYSSSISTTLSSTKMQSRLPHPEEVLICSEDTAQDEVERFMLKAMCKHPFDDVKPIFCMAYTEKLEFNVSTAVESTFKKLSINNEFLDKQYQLVFLSSSQDHYLSNCFSKYYVEKTPSVYPDEISSYIATEMTKEVMPGLQRAKVVTSRRSGLGKSLHVKRLSEKLPPKCHARTVRLLEKKINMHDVIERLRSDRDSENAGLIHIDLTPAVEEEIEKFVFNLIILGVIKDKEGNIWRIRENQSYVIEVTKSRRMNVLSYTLDLLPTAVCLSPEEVICYLDKGLEQDGHLLMDSKICNSDAFQRTSKYLLRFDQNDDFMDFSYEKTDLFVNEKKVIEVLLKHCGINLPTWAQLQYFVKFLNVQLINCEKSDFCQIYRQKSWIFKKNRATLQGFKKLAVNFMIKMATDFATPSLAISDESANDTEQEMAQNEEAGTVCADYKMRRKWEEYEHSYMFFNDDGHTMTFINVNIDEKGDLYSKNGQLLEKGIATERLVKDLKQQGFKFGYYFDKFSRDEMLAVLCNIMGVSQPFDPDETYKLTTDSVLKMIAIYLRLRCGIPVIVMGETGCGKTRMIEFMSKLQAGKQAGKQAPSKKPNKGGEPRTSMRIMKVHGGIEGKDIFRNVKDALENIAFEKECKLNQPKGDKKTILPKMLFFDEANTTNAIYAIKEVMCDQSTDGDEFTCGDATETSAPELQIVAACNPYKKLSEEALTKLEENGLRYRVSADAINKRVDKITMRTLVYRVVALPPSIQPFVWDFGQLSDTTEGVYIKYMISSNLDGKYGLKSGECSNIALVLSHIQVYMKKQITECRYVSLRDIERSIILFQWFEKHCERLFALMSEILKEEYSSHSPIPKYMRCLIHAVGVSYHVSLERRKNFRRELSRVLSKIGITCSESNILEEYEACQTVFHQGLEAGNSIAWNEALKENVFLMAICADAKLPLYIVGKPGSSKSLAKSIIKANLKGASSSSKFFRGLKKVEVLTFQCSALTEASGIQKMFQDAEERQIQRNNTEETKDTRILAVFDEIGLAEDSPNMPLKILHSLLEDGYAQTANLLRSNGKKGIAFLGISNWPLDPAKMNRGIFVTRNTPVEEDLISTAKGIFQGSTRIDLPLLKMLTKTYLKICHGQGDQFFGLRDYYSMIKMIHTITKDGQEIKQEEIAYILARNFSGGEERHTKIFNQAVHEHMNFPDKLTVGISLKSLVNDCVNKPDSRFLLLLTKHHASVDLLHHVIPNFENHGSVMFGSNFPGDHTDKELCKSINKIKVCMEQGKLVISLNMVDIYESLYEVLNQNYVEFGDQRYVTISLGSNEVWVKIHKDFRLIVIERNEVAHEQYPIPLLNRLEKHHLVSRGLLTKDQLAACDSLSKWIEKFSNVNGFAKENAFPGMHDDTISSVVLSFGCEGSEVHRKEMQSFLLDIATIDSMFRLPDSQLSKEDIQAATGYYMKYHVHDCLFNLLRYLKGCEEKIHILEVVTFSSILTKDMKINLEKELQLIENSIMLLSLQSFKIEEEYDKEILAFIKRCKTGANAQRDDATEHVPLDKNTAILLIQTSRAHENGQLMEYAKHHFMSKFQKENIGSFNAETVIVIFLHSTERLCQRDTNISKMILQPTKKCKTMYIDELGHTRSNTFTTLACNVHDKSVMDIIRIGKDNLNNEDNFVRCLILDSVSDAMSRLTDPNDSPKIQAERIKIMRDISHGPDSRTPDISHAFLGILLDKITMICQPPPNEHDFADQEAFTLEIEKVECAIGLVSRDDWVKDEACSPERLQEGGTFGRTIHLCLKRFISPMLAFIVSIIDVNGNMGILTTSDVEIDWRVDLWLKLFKSLELKIPAQNQFKYVVNSSTNYNPDEHCEFPFSFLINEKFKELYDMAKVSPSDSDHEIKFTNLVKKQDKQLELVEMAWHTSSKETREREMMKAYINDLLRCQLHRNIENDRVFAAMVKIALEYSMKRWSDSERKVNGLAIAFYNLMKLSEYLAIISRILSDHRETVNEVDAWIQKQLNTPNFEIHEYALHSLLDQVYIKCSHIGDETTCIEWMNISSKVRKIYKTSINLVKSTEERRKFWAKWKPLGLIDTMLVDLIPLNSKDLEFLKFVSIIAKQAKRCFQFMEKRTSISEFHSKDVLKMVVNVLNASHSSFNISLMINWTEPKCLCGKIFQNPVKLPCGKYACHRCAKTATCPYCSENLPEDLKGICLTAEQRTLLNKFRSDCTAFFLEYLNEYCFEEDDDTDMELKLKAIFQRAIKLSPAETIKDQYKLVTSHLDLNLCSRSSIVNIIQRVYPDFIKEAMDEILGKKDVDENLLLVVLKALEAQLLGAHSGKNLSESNAEMLRLSWPKLHENSEKLLSYDILVDVAKVRVALGLFMKYVYGKRTAENEVPPPLILTVKHLCEQENAKKLSYFISKLGTLHHGRKWLSLVEQNLLLKHLLEKNKHMYGAKDTSVDLWEIFGDEYRGIDSTACKSLEIVKNDCNGTSQSEEKTVTRQQFVTILAAINCGKLSNVNPIIKSSLGENEQKIITEGSANLKKYLKSNSISGLTKREAHALYQVVLSSVGAILCKRPLMKELCNILVNPESTKELFWPAMPESLYHSVRDAMEEEAAYTCPNGHTYFIGDCTYPWMMSRCPDCGCPIGGFFHMAAKNNTRVPMGRVCKTGYRLQEKMMGFDNPGDRITPQAAAIIQFFIHSAMIMALSMKCSRAIISSMIFNEDLTKGIAFLVAKLQENIEEMSTSLGCTIDDGLLLILQVNKAIISEDYHENINTNCDWWTQKSCKEWEIQFRRAYLQPIFHKAEENIFEAKENLSGINDMDRLFLENDEHGSERLTCFHPVVWTALREPSAEHLLHNIIDSPEPGAILKTILQTPNLHFVKYLQDTLELQRILISRYQYKYDKKKVENISFDKVRRELKEFDMAKLIDNYISLWNQVHPVLGARNPSDSILGGNMKTIDANSPITMVLPSIRGRGRCAKLLTEYLVMLQNDFLDNCKAADPSLDKFTEIEVSNLLDSHYVCVDKHQDLLPMIQFHSAYTIRKGKHGHHHQITYNIAALERLVKEKHVMYKKKILKESLPHMRYADTGVGSDWDKLNESVKQIYLPHHLAKEIDEMMDELTLSEICEKVRIFTQTIAFLAKVKIQGDSKNRKLREYLENDLVMTSKHVNMIPRSLFLSQTLALYQKLTWHKAVRFVQQGLDPYKDYLDKEDQAEIQDAKLLEQLKECFEKTDLVGLQKHINEILIKTDSTEFKPTWSLKAILPNVEYVQESNDESWYSNLPEEVELRHVSDLFRLCVQGIP